MFVSLGLDCRRLSLSENRREHRDTNHHWDTENPEKRTTEIIENKVRTPFCLLGG